MRELIIKKNDSLVLDNDVSALIAEYERKMKELKAHEEDLKKAILSEMQEKGLLKLDTPEMTITYVDSFDKETFDSKTFRTENPALYDDYVKITTVKPSIRIKLKEVS